MLPSDIWKCLSSFVELLLLLPLFEIEYLSHVWNNYAGNVTHLLDFCLIRTVHIWVNKSLNQNVFVTKYYFESEIA